MVGANLLEGPQPDRGRVAEVLTACDPGAGGVESVHGLAQEPEGIDGPELERVVAEGAERFPVAPPERRAGIAYEIHGARRAGFAAPGPCLPFQTVSPETSLPLLPATTPSSPDCWREVRREDGSAAGAGPADRPARLAALDPGALRADGVARIARGLEAGPEHGPALADHPGGEQRAAGDVRRAAAGATRSDERRARHAQRAGGPDQLARRPGPVRLAELSEDPLHRHRGTHPDHRAAPRPAPRPGPRS